MSVQADETVCGTVSRNKNYILKRTKDSHFQKYKTKLKWGKTWFLDLMNPARISDALTPSALERTERVRQKWQAKLPKWMLACFPVDLVLNQFTPAKFPSILTFQLRRIQIYGVCKRGRESTLVQPAVTWPFVGNDASSIGSRDVKILNILSHVPVMESQPQGIFWQGLVSSDQIYFLFLFPSFIPPFFADVIKNEQNR